MFAGRNPFLVVGDDKFAIGGKIAAQGRTGWTLAPGTRLDANGSIAFQQFSDGYGNFVTGGAALSLDHRRDEYLSLHSEASFERVLPTEAIADSIDSAIDPLNLQDRYSLAQTVTWHSDALTTMSGRLGWTRLDPRGSDLLEKTRAIDANLDASRQIDAYTSIGARANFTWSKSQSGGDPHAWSVRLTVERRFDHAWRAEFGAGVTQTSRLDDLGRRGGPGVQFAGNLRLCHEPGRLTACVTASIEPVVSSYGGIRRETALGATLGWRTSARGTISATADYRLSPQPSPDPDIEATSITARYDHRLNGQTSLFGGLEYRQRTDVSGRSVDAAVARLGISIGIPRP